MKSSHPVFARKISENLILKNLQELLSFNFKEVTLFKNIKDSEIHFYFSDDAWEKTYLKNDFYLIDPCVQGLLNSPAPIVPWVSLPQASSVMLERKKKNIENGLSLLVNSFMAHLGGDDQLITNLLNSKTSLEKIFSTVKKMSDIL